MIKTFFVGCLSVSLALGQCPLILTEIQADPTPSRGLPEIEYLEIYVDSPSPISTNGWSIQVNASLATFSSHLLQPYTRYVLVAESQRSRVTWLAHTVGLSRLTLPNAGAVVTIRSPSGPCHTVAYQPSWGKRYLEGGISLELTNVSGACLGRVVWQSSDSPTGGTPGEPPMRGEQTLPLPYVRFVSPDSLGWTIHFSQAMDPLAGEWNKQPLQGAWQNESVFYVNQAPPPDRWQTGTLSQWYDCTQQPIVDTTLSWGWFKPPLPGEWKWNEILVAPVAGSQGFAEIKSEASVPRLWPGGMLRYQSSSSTRVSEINVPARGQILSPGDVWALTGQNPRWESLYHVGPRIDSLENWVDFANEGGRLTLLSSSHTLDEVTYSPAWHHALVLADEGRSWQRHRAIWSPTSTLWGLATPGWEPADSLETEPWSFEPAYVSNQNTEALLTFSLPDVDFVLETSIVDATGHLVYRYPTSHTWPKSGQVSWSFPSLPGLAKHYYLVVQGFHPDGRVFRKWVPFIWEFD